MNIKKWKEFLGTEYINDEWYFTCDNTKIKSKLYMSGGMQLKFIHNNLAMSLLP